MVVNAQQKEIGPFTIDAINRPNTFSEAIGGHTITGTYTYTGAVVTLGGIQFSQAQAGGYNVWNVRHVWNG